jgi:Rieske Fe-S protein
MTFYNAIDTACKNGFEPEFTGTWATIRHKRKSLDFWFINKKRSIIFKASYHKENGYATATYTIWELIFGTDFIDKLVGEVPVCGHCGKKLILTDIGLERCYCHGSPYSMNSAHYHRSQMVNIMDVEKLKEYIINKILKGE